MNNEWYQDFLLEIKRLENELKCPQCEGTLIMHINPMGYDFLCSTCGISFEHLNGKFKDKFENLIYTKKEEEI